MSKDPLDLKQYIRTVDNFPIDGIEFKDITSLIETPEALLKHVMSLPGSQKNLAQI